MRSVEVMVAGGGASGMMAAITAAEAGARVVLMEKLDRVGKKLLATGNGRCNYTNRDQKPEYYHSRTAEFAWQVISGFDEKQVINWFQERGILPMEREGYVYPRSAQAASVVRVLQRLLKDTGVSVHTDEPLRALKPRIGLQGECRGYEVVTQSDRYLANQVILASGGAASPVHGTTGDGYAWMKRLGVRIEQPLPALTSLILDDPCCKIWAGVRIPGQVSVYREDGTCLGQDRGEIQMVSYGISGIPVFQISHLVSRELAAGGCPFLTLDSMCEYSESEVLAELSRRRSVYAHGTYSAAEVLVGMLPDKLIKAYLTAAGIRADAAADDVKIQQWERLAGQIKGKRWKIHDVSGFEKAQVTSGGVSLAALDVDTLEVKGYPGLYIAGELADVDGICGGYNLQWAWASGRLAGLAAAARACRAPYGGRSADKQEHGGRRKRGHR